MISKAKHYRYEAMAAIQDARLLIRHSGFYDAANILWRLEKAQLLFRLATRGEELETLEKQLAMSYPDWACAGSHKGDPCCKPHEKGRRFCNEHMPHGEGVIL
jgi:hypothetical protein